MSPVIKRNEYCYGVRRGCVFMLQHADSYIQRSACMCPCSLCVHFMPDSTADPIELFSSVAFLKNLFVEYFHIPKVMFGFFFLCCKKQKQGKQKLDFKKIFFFLNQKCLLNTRQFLPPLVLIFHWKGMWEEKEDFNKA